MRKDAVTSEGTLRDPTWSIYVIGLKILTIIIKNWRIN